ncbi:hypothetical protein NPIL_249241 [Nephila pilipes]|uniref:Uncharacterized protein n=1 Tax=Nephila pilipes TaxID=299642 RepID=A0A8X6TFF8_NEPPI|nr:hypothetical protein NPIL_249241 [Nephila pilipes]
MARRYVAGRTIPCRIVSTPRCLLRQAGRSRKSHYAAWRSRRLPLAQTNRPATTAGTTNPRSTLSRKVCEQQMAAGGCFADRAKNAARARRRRRCCLPACLPPAIPAIAAKRW